jgi:tetratricopeptide (TPR) repeat protein
MPVDKTRKLRRYTRKDYSHVVDFPVEIVGRDGVVRRYSFEESVRLYQRRIASATMRYRGDHDVVDAEVQHCRRRIEQLRRSYFARYGWSAIKVVDSPGVLAGEFAGEVAAFLRRCLEGTTLDPEALEFTYLEEGEHRQVYFVQQRLWDFAPAGRAVREAQTSERYLLYLYRFDTGTAEDARDGFFQFLKVLQSARSGGDGTETLVAFHHSADCGLVLTGQKGAVKEFVADLDDPVGEIDLSWMEERAEAADLLREGMALLRQGRREDALARFVQAYEDNHYRGAAYIGAAVVADQLGQFAQAEAAARMGTHYFPDDAALVYHLALAQLRQGDVAGAEQALAKSEGLDAGRYHFDVLRGVLALRRGDVRAGRRQLVSALAAPDDADADLLSAHRWLVSHLRARGALVTLGAALALAGGALALVVGAWWLVLAGTGAAMVPAVHFVWRRQLLATLELPGGKGLRLASPSMMRPVTETGPAPL